MCGFSPSGENNGHCGGAVGGGDADIGGGDADIGGADGDNGVMMVMTTTTVMMQCVSVCE